MQFILLALILFGLLGVGIYFYSNNIPNMEKTLDGFEVKEFKDVSSDMMSKAEQAKKDLAKKQEENEKIDKELVEESKKIGKYLSNKEKGE